MALLVVWVGALRVVVIAEEVVTWILLYSVGDVPSLEGSVGGA